MSHFSSSHAKQSKWITFVDVGKSKSGLTKIWDVRPTEKKEDSFAGIGVISWYASWRKYAFQPKGNTVFEQDCLRDIADFIEDATKQHKGANP